MKENPLAMKSGDRILAAPSRGGKTLGTPATDQILTLEAQYKALLSAFAKQEQTMKKVAAELRWAIDNQPRPSSLGLFAEVSGWADTLDPREPIAEADAAEKFSQSCAKQRGEK